MKKLYKQEPIYRLLTQTTFWNTGREQLSQFTEQAKNHHAGNIKFTEQISWNKIFISRSNCVQRGKVLKHVLKFSDLGTHFKHTSHLATQELGVKNGIIKGKGEAQATRNPTSEEVFKTTP